MIGISELGTKMKLKLAVDSFGATRRNGIDENIKIGAVIHKLDKRTIVVNVSVLKGNEN